jgi:tetratricopeptide (TPR) repeat protein
LRKLRLSEARLDHAALGAFPGGARFRKTGLMLFCLGVCSLGGVRAESAAASPALPLKSEIILPSHLTDAQDRLMSGQLHPVAEARSRANALYAEALLLPEGLVGDQQQALDLFRQIVALDPSFTDARIKLANLLIQSGQLDLALAQLQTASASHPGSIPIEVALGYTQRLRGQNDEALRLCTRALTSDSSQFLAMRVLLEIAGDQDDLAGGVLHIEDILKAGGVNAPASAWLNLARLYLEVARGERLPPPDDVILRTRLPILQQAAAKSPPDVETLTLLADTYRDLGLKAAALKTLRRAVALDPSDGDRVLHCADLESGLGETADAIKDYEKAYALSPGLPGLRERLEGLYQDNQRYEAAARLYEEALVDSPQNPGLEIDLGIAYEESHHPQKAQACFQQVFDSIACPPDAYLKLAFFQLDHKEVKEAGGTLASAQAHFPQSPRIRFYEAIQHRYERNYDAALACLAQVRALASGSEADALDPAYYLESALTLNLAGQKDRLEAVLREGLGKYPDNPELMNELAYFWADQGHHLPEALALSRRAAALDPDNGPILDTWGWVYFQMGQAKDALPYLQRAAFMTNNDPVVLQHVGDAYLKLGLRREAIATWTRALEKDPRNGDLTNRIDAALAQAKNAHLRSAPNP